VHRLLLVIVAIALLFPAFMQGGPKTHPLGEDVALNLLLRTLERDHVYDKRISLDCVTFDTENITRIYFEFALREKHTPKCGGDPETSPVIDRYRVNRASGKIELYDTAKDNWQFYKGAHNSGQ
jgi:hypothetical protein